VSPPASIQTGNPLLGIWEENSFRKNQDSDEVEASNVMYKNH